MRIAPIKKLIVFDVIPCGGNRGMYFSLRIDGVTVYSKRTAELQELKSAENTVGAFLNEKAESLYAWIDPQSGKFVVTDDTGTVSPSVLILGALSVATVLAVILSGLWSDAFLQMPLFAWVLCLIVMTSGKISADKKVEETLRSALNTYRQEPEMGNHTKTPLVSYGTGPIRRGSVRQALGALVIICVSLVGLSNFAASLRSFPSGANASNTPEVEVTASYLREGKSRLELTTPDGKPHRHTCDPLAKLCRYVMEHSPVVLKVRTVAPGSGLSDSALLAARDGDTVLVNDQEGQENLVSLRNICVGGIVSSVGCLLIGCLLLRYGIPSKWKFAVARI